MRSLQSGFFLTSTLMLFLLMVTTKSDNTDLQLEARDESLRHLHNNRQEWSDQDTVVVFPEDSSIAALALPGSQPIRPRNPNRRRRKRPRPQLPQETNLPLPTRNIDGTVPYKEQTSNYKFTQTDLISQNQKGNDELIRQPQILSSNDQQYNPQKRHPFLSEQHQYVQQSSQISIEGDDPYIQFKTDRDTHLEENVKPDERPFEVSFKQDRNANEETHNGSPSFTDGNIKHKRQRGDQQTQSHTDESAGEFTNDSFRPQQYTRNNSYRKPYPAQSQGHNNNIPVSPQNLKALLKQQSGSVSLSELLQQKNLSLADLLKGNSNALSALTGVQTTVTPNNNQERVPPRRLPPAQTTRRKNHNINREEKPQRYSQILEDESLESTTQRRFSPVNKPSQRTPPLVDQEKHLGYHNGEHGQASSEPNERINKFVPSSPRRTTTASSKIDSTTDTISISSTDNIGVTNSIIPHLKTSHNIFTNSPLHNHNEHSEKDYENERGGKDSNEHNAVISLNIPELSKKNPLEEIQPYETVTTFKPAPIPLNKQETSVIDPLENSPEMDSLDQKTLDYNRLRGKYLTRHRTSVPQNNSNKVDNTKTTRLRLPPSNIFLSALRPRVTNKSSNRPEIPARITSTEPSQTTESSQLPNVVEQSYTTLTNEVHTANSDIPHITETEMKQHHSLPTHIDNNSKPSYQIPNSTAENILLETAEVGDSEEFIKLPSNYSQNIQENNNAKTTSARDELLEFLKTETGSVRLARILASRNMTLAELIEHRERGSSQQHLAEIFGTPGQPDNDSIKDSISGEDIYLHNDTINNEVMYSILNNIQHDEPTNISNKNINNNNITKFQDMFSFLETASRELPNFQKNQQELPASTLIQKETSTSDHFTEDSEESEIYTENTSSREPRLFDSLPSFPPPQQLSPSTSDKPSVFHPVSIPSWKVAYQHPAAIYSFDPTNIYHNPGRRPIITSRLITTTQSTPLSDNDITEGIVLLGNIGQVHEVGNTGIGGMKGTVHLNRDERKQYNVLNRENFGDETDTDGGLPTDVKSAIIVSSAILGAAILGFLAIFVVCRWRQRQARRRFVDGIINTQAHSPILMQTEGKTSHGSLSPVMVDTRNLYKRDLSIDGDDNMNPGTRRYYLWRTIRKTLRYK